MSGGNKEAERISQEDDPNRAAFLRALFNIKLLDELPESEEAIEQWEKQNPEKARQLEAMVDHLSGEFSLQNSQNSPPEND